MTTIRDAAAGLAAARRARYPYLFNRHTVGRAICATAASLVGLSGVAFAQQPPTTTTPGAQSTNQPVSLEEVTVTGSRIKRTTDFNTPTPTTVIDAATLDSIGAVNVGQVLTITPANVSTFTPANTGNSNFFSGSFIPDLRGLNPFFGSRTLVMVNSRRVVPTNQGDSVDLNFIPQILVDRIDTVTGGASAAYGSGAIAGVMNIMLNTKLEGGKITGSFSQTEKSDARDRSVGAAYGHGLFDNRIHFVIGGEYQTTDAVDCLSRTWCAQNEGLYSGNAANPAVNPAITLLDQGTNLRYNQISPGGVFSVAGGPFPPNPYAGYGTVLQANESGTAAVGYALGQQPYSTAFLSNVFTANPPGGDGPPLYQGSSLMAPVKRGVITGTLSAKVTDNINFTGDFNWGKVETTNYSFLHSGGLSVPTGTAPAPLAYPAYPTLPNPYIYGSPGMVSQLNQFFCGPGAPAFPPPCATAGGLTPLPTSFAIGKDWTGEIPNPTLVTTDVKRFSAGFDGKFGSSSWSWDTYFTYGLTDREQLLPNNIRAYSLLAALDAVTNPTTGQPECRSTYELQNGYTQVIDGVTLPITTYGPIASVLPGYVSNLLQGCVPLNILGTTPPSQAAQAYSFGPLDERQRYTQSVGAANVSGNWFRGIGAGPFAAAAGIEWRQEVMHNDEVACAAGDAHCQAQTTDFNIQYGTPFGGMVTVEEGYFETNLPLLKDLPAAHLLEIDAAVRYSHYETDPHYGLPLQNGANGLEPAFTNASNNNNLTTWKVSAIWEPLDWFRFRGSQSRDARAPNFRELLYGQILTAGSAFGSCAPPGPTFDPCTWYLEGNPKLSPETSDTTTLGIVLTPRDVLPGFQFSADWFHIKINQAIQQANPTVVQSECRAGNAQACSQIDFYPWDYTILQTPFGPAQAACPGAPAAFSPLPSCAGLTTFNGATAWQNGIYNASKFVATSFNGAFYEVRGVDFSLNYLQEIGKYGSLNTRLLTTWMDQQVYQNCTPGPTLPCVQYNILGQTGTGNTFLNDYTPTAKWRGSLLITWATGPLSLTPSMNFTGPGIRDYLGVTPNQPWYQEALVNPNILAPGIGLHPMADNHVPSYFLFNLNATYEFEQLASLKGLQVFLQINNVFNRTPPFAVGGGAFGPGNAYGGTNPIFFDTLGLSWRAGFRLNF